MEKEKERKSRESKEEEKEEPVSQWMDGLNKLKNRKEKEEVEVRWEIERHRSINESHSVREGEHACVRDSVQFSSVHWASHSRWMFLISWRPHCF